MSELCLRRPEYRLISSPVERHKLDLARQGRKVKKLTKQTLAEQEEVEQVSRLSFYQPFSPSERS
jgi:hypothetical protein